MDCPTPKYKESIDPPPNYDEINCSSSDTVNIKIECPECNGSCKCRKCDIFGVVWSHFKGSYIQFHKHTGSKLTYPELVRIYKYGNYEYFNSPPLSDLFSVYIEGAMVKKYRYLGNNTIVKKSGKRNKKLPIECHYKIPIDENDIWKILIKCPCRKTFTCNTCDGKGWKYSKYI